MASPAQPLTSSTNLQPTGKPSFNVAGDSATVQAIVTNAAFPASPAGSTTIEGLSITAGNQGMSLVTLPGVDNGTVAFDFGVQAGASLAQYTDASKLANDLGFSPAGSNPLNVSFPADPGTRYMLLKCDYTVSGSASGKIALNPDITVNFGASAQSHGEFAFIRAVPLALGAQSACLALLSDWCVPAAVVNGGAFPYGYWIVTEVDGQISGHLGVEAGYDFNWVKAVALHELDGDIGLRIALGLKATLSASLSGKFVLVLNRESPASGIRLRLFRSSTHGWNFALNADASVTLQTPQADNLTDFIKAVFGIQDAQLISFLQAANLQDIATALGNEFLSRFDLGGEVNAGFARLKALLAKWENLPNAVTTTLWKYADQIPALQAIENAARLIATSTPASLKAYLDTLLQDTNFYQNPVCEWLESAASSSLFELYEHESAEIRAYAAEALSVLDGADLQAALQALKAKVNTALNLPALEAAVSNGDLSGVATWVAQQLARFLGVKLDDLHANIAKINTAITFLRARADAIFAATQKALNTSYGFSLSEAYAASSMQAALLDVEFSDGARPQLAQAILGRFGDILNTRIDGVTLRTATLTHAVTRHQHLEVHLPWWSSVADELTQGSATAKFVDGVDGRVQFYEASATDTDSLVTQSAQRFASCSIGISGSTQGVRRYNTQAVDFGYSFITAQPAMTVSQLTYAFKDAAQQYFGNVFGNGNADPDHGTFEGWVAALDKQTDAVSTFPNSSLVIGPVWAKLQVALRATPKTDWVTPLLNGTEADYAAMSLAMQRSIRQWMLVAYSANLKRLADGGSANPTSAAFLVYVALPSLNKLRLSNGSLIPEQGIYSDVWDTAVVQAICDVYARRNLQVILQNIGTMLAGMPAYKKNAGYYLGQTEQVYGMVHNTDRPVQGFDPIMRLLQAEATVIDDARNAFRNLQKAGAKELENALPSFTAAVVKLARTFNTSLAKLSLDAPEIMRLFSPLILQDALRAMFGVAGTYQQPPDVMLDVALLNNPAGLGSDAPPAASTLLRQHIINFG